MGSSWENIGTKADESAPSATKLLKRLGIRKATKKLSARRVAPKSRATRRSLTKPNMRLTSVSIETIPVPRAKCDLAVVSDFGVFMH